MNIRQLKAFIALAESGSMRKAAERLYLTPPGIRHLIGVLEAKCGFKLFVRTSSGVSLTEEGVVFLGHAKQALSILSDGIKTAQSVSKPKTKGLRVYYLDQVRVAYSPTFKSATAAFAKMHPEITVFHRMVNSLVGVEFDVICNYTGDCDSPTAAHYIETLPLCCGVLREDPLGRRDAICLEDIDSYSLVVPPDSVVQYMDAATQKYIRGRVGGTRPSSPKAVVRSKGDNGAWCMDCNGASIGVGYWNNDYPLLPMVYIPIEGGRFELNIFTPPEPSEEAQILLAFLDDYYRAHGGCAFNKVFD